MDFALSLTSDLYATGATLLHLLSQKAPSELLRPDMSLKSPERSTRPGSLTSTVACILAGWAFGWFLFAQYEKSMPSDVEATTISILGGLVGLIPMLTRRWLVEDDMKHRGVSEKQLAWLDWALRRMKNQGDGEGFSLSRGQRQLVLQHLLQLQAEALEATETLAHVK